MADKISIVILAAGKGTRLKMDIPKPLAPLEDRTLLDFVLDASSELGHVHFVTGSGKELVESHIEKKWSSLDRSFVHQKEQLGTGHAVRTYFEQTKDAEDFEYTVVACADTPLITKDVFDKITQELKRGYDAVCASFIASKPAGYGRILRADKGFSIVEEKDASESDKKITEVNSGLYIFKTSYLKEHVFNLDTDNNSGEFYLTDTCKKGANVSALIFDDPDLFLGVNDLYQLSVAGIRLRKRNMMHILKEGVRVIDPSHTFISTKDVGLGTLLYPNVHIDSKSKIGKNVIIEPGCFIKNSIIEDGVHLKAYTYITDSVVRKSAKVGPMSQLRPGSDIGAGSKLGNFVEIKQSTIAENSSVSHLSYIGDAEIGSDVNIGCGFITCNYDGAKKHKTLIGDGSFVGSDCQVIAPISIGKEAYVGSGSTLNKNVPDGAFAIARSRQETKEGMARKFIKKKS
jgi:bifunctional UDP-N-acetylglucosamine pyrophosphorylase/glucosamine-1-phosphate N-acetyltransferase